MIYDCFLFNNELDLLEIRVNELSSCTQPVMHLLVESKWTFTGQEKPLFFAENSEKFADFPIMSIAVDNMPDTNNSWDREKFQRNIIQNALSILYPSDKSIVIISDVDEIPNHKSVDWVADNHNLEFAALAMRKYAYYFNFKEKGLWDRARIMQYSYLKNKTPDEIRNSGFNRTVVDAGWHFSWLHDKAQEKLKSFSHVELNTPANSAKIDEFKNFWNDSNMKTVDIDNTFPEYLVKNIEKFKHLIK